MADEAEGAPHLHGANSFTTGEGWEPVSCRGWPEVEKRGGDSWGLALAWPCAAAREDDISVFPPGDHEGLYTRCASEEEDGEASDREVSPSVSSSSFSVFDYVAKDGNWGLGNGDAEGKWCCVLELGRKVVGLGFETAYSKILPWYRVWGGKVGGRSGEWVPAAALGLALVLLYIRRRHRRERIGLLLRIQDKDQKIAQLLHQIVQLNEMLNARHKVPVLRLT